MALSTTGSVTEFRTAWEATVKLEKCLAFYASGAAAPTVPGRFTEAQVQAAIDAVQAALTALEA